MAFGLFFRCVKCGKTKFFEKKEHLDDGDYCQECYWAVVKEREKQKREEAERKKREIKELEEKMRREKLDAEFVEKNRKWAAHVNEVCGRIECTVNALPRYNIELSQPVKRQTCMELPTFNNITPKGKYNDVVVFDTETTGLAPGRDRIIEIAAVRFVDGEATEVFHTYINPGRPIPKEAQAVNHITDEKVADAPSIGQILPAFDKFIGSSALVAHNLEFDLRFIYYSGSKVLETKRKYYDTLAQSRRKIPKREVENYKLESVCDYYGIRIPNAHSALWDAYCTGELFFELVDEVVDE